MIGIVGNQAIIYASISPKFAFFFNVYENILSIQHTMVYVRRREREAAMHNDGNFLAVAIDVSLWIDIIS